MATELGKAYIQIVPSAQGIKGSLMKSIGAEQVGQQAGSKLGAAFKKAFIALGVGTAIAKTIKSALSQGAELEQSIGGIETLFKGSADKVKAYANQAYKTAGLSANEYMKNVTSFSASLLQSLGGDTSKAADISNMAMMDMADNMNKMGTPLQDIQNAYQGFAKQNYTMLDNLKLGYGGTKQEMERLLADAEKLTGKKYDINNLSDVYEAIHAVQKELDITGTTAKEAESTLSGSFGMMKAAWQDLLGKAAIGENLSEPIKHLVESVMATLKNAIPMIINIVTTLPVAIFQTFAGLAPTLIPMLVQNIIDLINGVVAALPALLQACLQIITGLADGLIAAIPLLLVALPQIIEGITTFFVGAIPQIVETGIKLLTALTKAMPTIITQIVTVIPQIINSIVNAIIPLIPLIVQAGVQLLVALVQALPQIIQAIIPAIPTIVTSIVNAIANNIPLLVRAGFDLLVAIIKALPQIIVTVARAVPAIIRSLVSAFGGGVHQMASAGRNLLMGLARGIGEAVSGVVRAAASACKSVLKTVKGIFGIHSPSKVFEGIGIYLNEGLAKGIRESLNPVKTAMNDVRDIATQDFESSIGISARKGSMAVDRILPDFGSDIKETKPEGVNQTINIYQPVKTPAEIARELRKQAIRLGFAGA